MEFSASGGRRVKCPSVSLRWFSGRFAFCLICLAALFVSSCASASGGGAESYPLPITTNSISDKARPGLRRPRREGLHIYAVYKSETFRRAYIDEYASRYALSDELREVLLKLELESGEKYNEFLISAYTPVDEWNDFDDREPTWRMYLSDKSGARLEPVEIKRLDAKDPLYREFYPFIDYWSYVYSVRFPKYGVNGTNPHGRRGQRIPHPTVTGIKGPGYSSGFFPKRIEKAGQMSLFKRLSGKSGYGAMTVFVILGMSSAFFNDSPLHRES